MLRSRTDIFEKKLFHNYISLIMICPNLSAKFPFSVVKYPNEKIIKTKSADKSKTYYYLSQIGSKVLSLVQF